MNGLDKFSIFTNFQEVTFDETLKANKAIERATCFLYQTTKL